MDRNVAYSTIRFTAAGLLVALVVGGVWYLDEREDRALDERLRALEERLAPGGIDGTELARRAALRDRSQEDRLTDAVASITPSVVSVVVSRDVPTFDVEYINPFGEDPYFRDFGARVPHYIPRGVERREVGAGSGFILREDGLIVTNRHVVDEPDAIFTVLLNDGTQHQAELVYRDPGADIALLDIEGEGYEVAPLGESENLALGQTVFAIGNALGTFSNSISVGVVSGLHRDIQAASTLGGSEQLPNVIQTDAAINSGNSGGPLVNLEGSVIGVNVARAAGGENIGFAIPIDDVKQIIDAALSTTGA